MFVGWAADAAPPAAAETQTASAPVRDSSPYARPRERAVLSASYEAATTSAEYAKHWAKADNFSARRANSWEFRDILRRRARHEYWNDPWAVGIVDGLAQSIVGNGPRLRVQLPNRKVARRYEEAFLAWSKANYLPHELLTAAIARIVDGEVFFLETNNEDAKTDVQFTFAVLEADQISTPIPEYQNRNWVDGCYFNRAGRATTWHVLDEHPGDAMATWTKTDYDASRVAQWFRKKRPGQLRGVTEMVQNMPYFADSRRWHKATLRNAELNAEITGTLESQHFSDQDPVADPWDVVPIERGLMLTVPRGYKFNAHRSEQPTATFGAFQERNINTFARPHQMPFSVAMGDSSRANYSSARIDLQQWGKRLEIDQSHLDDFVLEWMLAKFDAEARLVPGLLDPETPPLQYMPHVWGYDGMPYVDPEKDARADTERLRNGTATHRDLLEAMNIDWQAHYEQLAIEAAERNRLNLAFDWAPAQVLEVAPASPAMAPQGA